MICQPVPKYMSHINTSRPAIAGKPRCSVYKLWPKYKCEKHASNITRDRPKTGFTFSAVNENGTENDFSFWARNLNETENQPSFSAENEKRNINYLKKQCFERTIITLISSFISSHLTHYLNRSCARNHVA